MPTRTRQLPLSPEEQKLLRAATIIYKMLRYEDRTARAKHGIVQMLRGLSTENFLAVVVFWKSVSGLDSLSLKDVATLAGWLRAGYSLNDIDDGITAAKDSCKPLWGAAFCTPYIEAAASDPVRRAARVGRNPNQGGPR